MDQSTFNQYFADADPPVVTLAIKPHFEALTEQQKLYAHHISRASFLGTRVTLRQTSPESEAIYDIIIALYHSCQGDWKQLQKETGVAKDELKAFLEYAAQFLANLGNYKGIGDSKFIPRLPPNSLSTLCQKVPKAKELLETIGGNGKAIFGNDDKPGLMHLGFPDKGHLSNYYPNSPTITEAEINTVGDFLASKDLLPENTRLTKLENGDFEVLVASAIRHPPAESIDVGSTTEWKLEGDLKDKTVKVVFGDHLEEMAKIALEIKKAEKYAENDREKKMMEEYARSFSTGSLLAFKESQKLWVKDLGPMVESNFGFIETYRDPAGIRGEWEGFVAMINKERTKAFTRLVEAAPTLIPKLPWSRDFEKDEFVAPDFTSLEVLTFAGSMIPGGINIPNYDDIRGEIGFKNVSLGNVISATAPSQPTPFIHPDDLELYNANRDISFEVQVGIHELLGHGTGKLLSETSPGHYNYTHSSPPISPLTSQPITTHYALNATYSSVFGPIASPYEECRAEAVAMVLATDFPLLSLFGCGDGRVDIDGPAGDVLHAVYLGMCRAGIAGLEMWDPKSGKWGQAHSRARYAILKVLLEAGEGLVTLSHAREDLSDSAVRVDRSKILTVGQKAMEAFLLKLHVYKCTGDVEKGRELFEGLTTVEGWWVEVREAVMRARLPRKIFVQANTFIEKDEKGKERVVLREYEASIEGMIKSYAEREV